ncbi:hypothetical protein LF1_53310 [Rubripirellula obstinata]|uniref:Uncharacterized protein n=1 Tax=Rubripirellula obstinata TaxID=406547 RepID=A0A5B1CBI1_9BACT|nr:hypothetical protein [Rubripirellula obstinata]KAA1257009.1 hypothetical protein LF1_57070 [Rubripirellula obstinata]KAA1257482.1 hypothetical protein LF1_53310 [Rubripirellula obstinata]
MTNTDFKDWATRNGLDAETANAIIDCAATPEEAKAAFDAMEPGPPIYPLDNICGLHDTDGYGASPGKHGFIFIGYCPNGDQIAVDIGDDCGSIWYIGHETMHAEPLRQNAVRVGDDLRSVHKSITTDFDFPRDFYDAKKQFGG